VCCRRIAYSAAATRGAIELLDTLAFLINSSRTQIEKQIDDAAKAAGAGDPVLTSSSSDLKPSHASRRQPCRPRPLGSVTTDRARVTQWRNGSAHFGVTVESSRAKNGQVARRSIGTSSEYSMREVALNIRRHAVDRRNSMRSAS
jgi:hypothetical protein